MSRNISTVEKVIIIVVIMAAILGLGIYFIVVPKNEDVSRVEAQIESMKAQIETAQQLLVREAQLDRDMNARRERAAEVHEGFFDEMTTTETVTFVQELLNNANFGRGFIAEYGIDVTLIEQEEFRLQLFLGNAPARYMLREYANLFLPPQEDLGLEALYAIFDEISDEWNPIMMAAEFAAGENADDDEIFAQYNEFAANPLFAWMAMTEMLKGYDLSAEDRDGFLRYLRPLIAVSNSGVGVIKADFTIRMTYTEYLDFLDYLHRYPLRLAVHRAVFFQHNEAAVEENTQFDETTGLADYEFTLHIYVVKPMDIPMEANEAEEEETADTQDEDEADEDE